MPRSTCAGRTLRQPALPANEMRAPRVRSVGLRSAILRSVAEGSEVQRHQRLVVCVLRSIAERMKIKDALVHKLPRTEAMPAFEKFAQTLRSVLVAAPVQRFRDAVSKENQAVTRVEVDSGALKFLVMEHANRQSWSADRVDSGSFHMKRS